MDDDEIVTGNEAVLRRRHLIRVLRRGRSIRTKRVEAAMRAVERHRFVPEVPLREAYADEVVVTKHSAAGEPISSASQPAMIAEMLEQLDVKPGHRVLEIGAGTGYNAALLAHLVGESGSVTTVDLDTDIVERARRSLAAVGCEDVRVVQGDGELGCPDGAPYDRIIVSVATWDLPPAWWEQLIEGGRLVAPLQVRTSEHSMAFDLEGGVMRSRSIVACGFVPMRGLGAWSDRAVALSKQRVAVLHIDSDAVVDEHISPLDLPGTTLWTGVQADPEEDSRSLCLWLAFAFRGYGRLSGSPVDFDQMRLLLRWASPAVLRGSDFAYATRRAAPDGAGIEIGVRGFGPHGEGLAAGLVDQIRAWDREGRHGPQGSGGPQSSGGLSIEAYRSGGELSAEARFVVEKRHTRLALISG